MLSIKEEDYLYKKIEDKFTKIEATQERDLYEKALEQRKKRIEDSSIKIPEIRHHQMEYMKQLKDRHSIGELKRIEEAKKSQLVSDWLTKSVQKTKIHKIVEE